jgi:hypothetical protein
MFKHSVQIYCLLYVGNADKADNTPWSSHADCCVKRCAIAYAFRNAFDASASHLTTSSMAFASWRVLTSELVPIFGQGRILVSGQ